MVVSLPPPNVVGQPEPPLPGEQPPLVPSVPAAGAGEPSDGAGEPPAVADDRTTRFLRSLIKLAGLPPNYKLRAAPRAD